MNQLLYIVPLLIVLNSLPVEAGKYSNKKSVSVSYKQAATVKVINGVPDKAYENLGVVVAESHNSKGAMKNLQKEAYKLGADAIIQFELKSVEGAGINIWWGTKKAKFIAQGTAVKWK